MSLFQKRTLYSESEGLYMFGRRVDLKKGDYQLYFEYKLRETNRSWPASFHLHTKLKNGVVKMHTKYTLTINITSADERNVLASC